MGSVPTTLRVSVTDRCAYRCAYCRPGSVAPFVAGEDRLTVEDYRALMPAFADACVTKVRFTGGEPLLRADLEEIVRAFREGLPHARLALTTNGHRLASRIASLAAAGLGAATVHVDTLRPDRYRALMVDDDLEPVLAAVLRAKPTLAVKLNVVVQRGRNDDELGDFLRFSRDTSIQVRFIELMNTGSSVAYTREAFVSGREIVERVNGTLLGRAHPSDPAVLHRTPEGVVFGVIASDTAPFCVDCNRLRLSAIGELRGCLYQPRGVDMKGALESNGRVDVAALVRRAAAEKQSFHPSRAPLVRLRFSMAETGG